LIGEEIFAFILQTRSTTLEFETTIAYALA